MVTALKLGGSVITRKERPETVDAETLNDVADAVADAHATGAVENLVLVHGGGSFGHPHAESHGVSTTGGTNDFRAVMDVHGAMLALNEAVLARLHDRDVPALPVHPLSGASREGDGTLAYALETVRTMLEEGFVPVLHGDGVAHSGEGVTVVSGDELVVRLAADLDADRVGLCSTVPGVLDLEDAVVPEIGAFEDVHDYLGGSDATDVTGGMAAKVRTLLETGVPAHVFGPDGLAEFLDGGSPGTRIDSG
jgi:isopentenyl phosphate kinase